MYRDRLLGNTVGEILASNRFVLEQMTAISDAAKLAEQYRLAFGGLDNLNSPAFRMAETLAANINRDMLRSIESFAGITPHTSSVAMMLEQLSVSRSILNSINWNTAFGLSRNLDKWNSLIQSRTFELTSKMSAFSESFLNLPKNTALPSFALRLPTIDVFVHSRSVKEIIQDDHAEDDNEEHHIEAPYDEIRIETRELLEVHLGTSHPTLLDMWRGARYVAASKSPDKPRQTCASLREMFKFLLDALAPDDRVLPWITDLGLRSDPRYYFKEAPTRRAKARYICRDLGNDKYSEFIRADMESAVALFGVLNKTTHEEDFILDNSQIDSVFLRLEVFFRHLLEIDKDNKNN